MLRRVLRIEAAEEVAALVGQGEGLAFGVCLQLGPRIGWADRGRSDAYRAESKGSADAILSAGRRETSEGASGVWRELFGLAEVEVRGFNVCLVWFPGDASINRGGVSGKGGIGGGALAWAFRGGYYQSG